MERRRDRQLRRRRPPGHRHRLRRGDGPVRLFPATFKGQSIDNTSIILSHTLTGDTDLNGTVNLTDFNRLAASFGGSGKRWSQGDFDYDGNVNLVDFNKLAANFGRTMASSAATGARDETTEGELIR